MFHIYRPNIVLIYKIVRLYLSAQPNNIAILIYFQPFYFNIHVFVPVVHVHSYIYSPVTYKLLYSPAITKYLNLYSPNNIYIKIAQLL